MARAACAALEEDYSPATDALIPSLALVLRRLRGVVIEPEAFNWDAVPEHLKMGFQVRNARNKILGEGKDLRALQQQLHKEIRGALADSLGASDDTIAKWWHSRRVDQVTQAARATRVAPRLLPREHEERSERHRSGS